MPYLPNAGAELEAIVKSDGWFTRVLLVRIGTLTAPWTANATPLREEVRKPIVGSMT